MAGSAKAVAAQQHHWESIRSAERRPFQTVLAGLGRLLLVGSYAVGGYYLWQLGAAGGNNRWIAIASASTAVGVTVLGRKYVKDYLIDPSSVGRVMRTWTDRATDLVRKDRSREVLNQPLIREDSPRYRVLNKLINQRGSELGKEFMDMWMDYLSATEGCQVIKDAVPAGPQVSLSQAIAEHTVPPGYRALLPIPFTTTGHFEGALVDFGKGRLEYYNSRGGKATGALKRELEEVSRHFLGHVHVVENTIRHQHDINQCGIHVADFFQRRLVGESFEAICRAPKSRTEILDFRDEVARKLALIEPPAVAGPGHEDVEGDDW